MNDHPESKQSPVLVPLEALSESTLKAVIENFIQREGTDYGSQEISLSTKVEQILKQLKKGEVLVVFDPGIESVTLLTKVEWNRLERSKVSN